jgi:hypothetical protein
MNDFSDNFDQLVSSFESGLTVESLLADINANEDLKCEWLYEHFSNSDEFFFIVHKSEVFRTDDDLYEYFDQDTLLQMGDDQVVAFINSRIDSCIDQGDALAVHFHEVSQSIISAIGESWGQEGIHFVDIDITDTRAERFQKLLDEGYLFVSNEHIVILEEFLVEKYQKFIRDRLKCV